MSDNLSEGGYEDLIRGVDEALEGLTAFRLRPLFSSSLPTTEGFDEVETDSFGQLIDKLLVVHIRYWNLENEMSSEMDDSVLASKRRASEPLFKLYRPMLVAALDKKIVNLLRQDLDSPSGQLPKSYKGWTSRDI